ncbi:hypothetical protein GVv1_29770 [Enterobacter pseudoroggenkampii]
MVPETAVGKDDALPGVDDEIRPARKRGILHAEVKARLRQQPGQSLFDGGVTRADGTHVFAARRLIVNIRH